MKKCFMASGLRLLGEGSLENGSSFFSWCFVSSMSGCKLDFRGKLAGEDLIRREMMFRCDWQYIGIWNWSAATR